MLSVLGWLFRFRNPFLTIHPVGSEFRGGGPCCGTPRGYTGGWWAIYPTKRHGEGGGEKVGIVVVLVVVVQGCEYHPPGEVACGGLC